MDLTMAPYKKQSCARTDPLPFRKHITYIEKRAARLYGLGVRRCRAQKSYGIKVNPIIHIKRDSEFLSRYRFPKVIVKRIAHEYGQSPFWEKRTDPEAPCCKKYVNAEWVVSVQILCMPLSFVLFYVVAFLSI